MQTLREISEILQRRIVPIGLKVDDKWADYNPLLRGSQVRFRSGAVIVDVLVARDDHDRESFRRRKRSSRHGTGHLTFDT